MGTSIDKTSISRPSLPLLLFCRVPCLFICDFLPHPPSTAYPRLYIPVLLQSALSFLFLSYHAGVYFSLHLETADPATCSDGIGASNTCVLRQPGPLPCIVLPLVEAGSLA
jgi:hypothetical protein